MRNYSKPPFPSQPRAVPVSQRRMDPVPGCGVAVAFARKGADVAVAYLDEHEDARETARWVEVAPIDVQLVSEQGTCISGTGYGITGGKPIL